MISRGKKKRKPADSGTSSLLDRRIGQNPSGPQTSIPTYYDDDYDEDSFDAYDDVNSGYNSKSTAVHTPTPMSAHVQIETYELDDGDIPGFEAMPDARDHQARLDEAEMIRAHESRRRAAIRARATRIAQYAFMLLCLYLAFLIYGVIVTHYDYDPQTGKIMAQTMSVRELAAASEFRSMQAFYLRGRWLYEETLRLDFKLHNNPENALIIATEYEILLEDVAKLSVDLNAASFSPAYNQLHAQLLNWVRTDTAVYLQNISAAITQSSQERANNAIISREIMYTHFLIISENIATYGKSVKGVSLGDVYEWSPERFVREELEGITDG